jgi:hypothetical protein
MNVCRSEATRCHEVAQSTKLGGKSCNSPIYVRRFQVTPTIKMADHGKRRGSRVNGNKMFKNIRHHSYDLYFKIMMIEHAEQINICETGIKYNLF